MKKNNNGLTLIEVLVAVSILAIVAIPLVRTFVTASSINGKSKWMGRSIDVGQNIMEGLVEESMEEIALQFNYPDAKFAMIAQNDIEEAKELELIHVDGEDVLQSAKRFDDLTQADKNRFDSLSESEKAALVTSSVISKDHGATYEFRKRTDGIYRFALKNIRDRGVGVDALVTIDASKYKTSGSFNDKEQINITNLDDTKDAIFVQPSDIDEKVAKHFQVLNASYGGAIAKKDEAFFLSMMTREITFTVQSQRAGETDLIKVLVKQEYLAPNGYVPSSERSYVEEQTLYNNTESKVPLRALYVFYNPLYSSTRSLVKDSIQVINSKNVPLKLYIAKQEVVPETQLQQKEQDYYMNLTVRDGVTQNTADSSISLFTNLGMNLYHTHEVMATPQVDQVHYSYINSASSFTNTAAKNKLQQKSLSDQKKDDYIFDVKVEVYKKGAYDKGFKESTRLATYEGSKLN